MGLELLLGIQRQISVRGCHEVVPALGALTLPHHPVFHHHGFITRPHAEPHQVPHRWSQGAAVLKFCHVSRVMQAGVSNICTGCWGALSCETAP